MDTMNIMTSCDNNLAIHILPQLASIHKSLGNYTINFFLMHSRISDENIKLIRGYASTLENIKFNEVFVTDNSFYEMLAEYGDGWPCEAYYWIAAHLHLPENVNRILYIDAGDVLIDGDISDFYFTDFENNLIVATAHITKTNEAGNSVIVPDDLDNNHLLDASRTVGIFCSGSILLNIEKMHETDIKQDSAAALERLKNAQHTMDNMDLRGKSSLYLGDQGIASIIFVGKVKFLNNPPNFFHMEYNFGLWWLYLNNQEDLHFTPKIIHYNKLNFKPWQVHFDPKLIAKYAFPINTEERSPFRLQASQAEYFDVYWRYCEMTPTYELVRERAVITTEILQNYYLPMCKQYDDLVGIHKETLDLVNKQKKLIELLSQN